MNPNTDTEWDQHKQVVMEAAAVPGGREAIKSLIRDLYGIDSPSSVSSLSLLQMRTLRDIAKAIIYANTEENPRAPPARNPAAPTADPTPAPAHGQQVGGNHYLQFAYQPYEIAEKNKLTFLEGSAVKRLHRHSRGGKGVQDLEKAIHEIRLLAQQQYGKEI